MFFNFASFISSSLIFKHILFLLFVAIVEYVAGYFSAFVIFKIYKKIIVNTATILPAALIIFAVLGDLSFAIQNSLDLNTLGHFIRNGLTIFVYYKMLKDYKN